MSGEFGKEIAKWMINHFEFSVIIILFILSCLFKLTKREIDPLGAVVRWVGKKLNHTVQEDVTALKQDLDNFEKKTSNDIEDMKNCSAKRYAELKTRLDEIESAQLKSNDMQMIQTIRAHILDFANSCFNKRKHTKLEFENIIDENTIYKGLVEKYGVENDVYKEDYDFIMKCYHKCQEEGAFLKEGD